MRGADLRYDLELEFNEAVFGAEKTIRVPRAISCRTCSGSGAKPGTTPEACKACGGRGQVIIGGPQAPGDDDETGAPQGLEQNLLKKFRLIPQDGDALHRQPGFMKAPGGVAGIKIGHPAGDQLGAGGDDFTLHD